MTVLFTEHHKTYYLVNTAQKSMPQEKWGTPANILVYRCALLIL